MVRGAGDGAGGSGFCGFLFSSGKWWGTRDVPLVEHCRAGTFHTGGFMHTGNGRAGGPRGMGVGGIDQIADEPGQNPLPGTVLGAGDPSVDRHSFRRGAYILKGCDGQ